MTVAISSDIKDAQLNIQASQNKDFHFNMIFVMF